MTATSVDVHGLGAADGGAPREAALDAPREARWDAPDVLRLLRSATAEDHRAVEDRLDLMDPALDRERLLRSMTLLHGFWHAAEAGLAGWAAREPAAAAGVDWPRRRRSHLYADDVASLGGAPAQGGPVLPAVRDTGAALGRLYVLEGATLGGALIDRHLATLPALAGVRLRAFSPYGGETGAMWHAYRQAVRAHVAAGGDAGQIVAAARGTFAALARWCADGTPAAA